ncbi:MAG: hypothetical protein ACE5JV_03965, partial [Nitrososphaerales archaeon]
SGVVVKLETVEGVLPSSRIFSVGIAWVPDGEDTFSVETFVWSSLDEPVPLSLKIPQIEINVSG